MTIKIPSVAVCWWRVVNDALDLDRLGVDTTRLWLLVHMGCYTEARETADIAVRQIGRER